MNRRKFLGIMGGGVVLAASAGATGFVMTRTPHKALAPWKLAGSGYKEPRMRALSYAILAPNPHNQQPWKVDLSEKGVVKLYVDTGRLLPHTDPFSRQITIGFGCFLEIFRMAAAEDGYRAEVEHFPEGFDDKKLDNRPFAVARLVKDNAVQKDPLFAHVLNRRSLKEPYDQSRKVSDATLKSLQAVVQNGSAVGGSIDMQHIKEMRDLTHKAMDIEMSTPRTHKESVDLFRIGKDEVNANPDGLTFPGTFFEILYATGQFNREGSLDMKSDMYKLGVDVVMKQIDTAMGHIWLITKGNTRLDQLSAGRDWVRLNLAATRDGVGIHPLSQALQEYKEMESHYAAIHKKLAPEGGTIQMLGRLGYASATPPTARWRIEEKIMKV